jgi:hypothetical protein
LKIKFNRLYIGVSYTILPKNKKKLIFGRHFMSVRDNFERGLCQQLITNAGLCATAIFTGKAIFPSSTAKTSALALAAITTLTATIYAAAACDNPSINSFAEGRDWALNHFSDCLQDLVE